MSQTVNPLTPQDSEVAALIVERDALAAQVAAVKEQARSWHHYSARLRAGGARRQAKATVLRQVARRLDSILSGGDSDEAAR